MDTLLYAFRAVMPILILIALGYVLAHYGAWKTEFFSRMSGFCYHIMLPVQLFYNVYKIEELSAVNWRVIGYTIAWIPLEILLGILAAKLCIRERSQKSALVQATFRSNQAILGIPLAESLGGAEAVAVASVATSLGIPLFNISAVVVLKAYSAVGGKLRKAELFKAILANPLIRGVFCGILCVLVRQWIPRTDGVLAFSIQNQLPSVYKTITNMSAVASPMMLLCLGAQLDFRMTGKLLPQISFGVFMRLILCPVLAIGGALLLKGVLGLTYVEIPMMLCFFASPVAVSSAIMVQEIGGDGQYASQLVVWSSAFSMLTLFVFVAILRGIGML